MSEESTLGIYIKNGLTAGTLYNGIFGLTAGVHVDAQHAATGIAAPDFCFCFGADQGRETSTPSNPEP